MGRRKLMSDWFDDVCYGMSSCMISFVLMLRQWRLGRAFLCRNLLVFRIVVDDISASYPL